MKQVRIDVPENQFRSTGFGRGGFQGFDNYSQNNATNSNRNFTSGRFSAGESASEYQRFKTGKPDNMDPNQMRDYMDQLPSELQGAFESYMGKEGIRVGSDSRMGSAHGSQPLSSGKSGDRYISQQEMMRFKREPFSQPNRPTLKFKQLSTLYPTAKTGTFLNHLTGGHDTPQETAREDREAVESLEKWDNEFKLQMMSKAVENDKKNENKGVNVHNERMDFQKTPSLNLEILNLVNDDAAFFRQSDKDGKYASGNTVSKSKIRVPQKSLETIMAETNKKILNEILFQRVSKQLTVKDPNQQTRFELDYKTKSISSDTVSNFKNLQQTFQANPRIIEYDQLYSKLSVEKNPPEKIFDFREEQKKMELAENDFASIEASLKSQYEFVINDIHAKKELVNQLRLSVHGNMNRIKKIQEEIEDIRRKYDALETQLSLQKKENQPAKRTQGRRPAKLTGNSTSFGEYEKISRQMDEKAEQERDKRNLIQKIQFETDKSQQKLISLEREIKDSKFKKNQLRLQLKQLYIKILKSEEHILQHEASFIAVIKNLWKINEEVVEDMFPNFLDSEAMKYLIENARLEYELEQLEFIMKHEEFRDFGDRDLQNRDDIYSRFMKTQQTLKQSFSETLADVQKRLMGLKKGIVKMKRPVFIRDGTAKNRIIRWEELNLEANELDSNTQDRQYIQEKINIAVSNIKKKLAELREKEINRIFDLYITKDIDEKALRHLNKVLISLFGRQNAENIYLRFIRLKQTHALRVSQNKTFVFSSTKNFSNSMVNNNSQNNFTMMLSYASKFRPEKKADMLTTFYSEKDQTNRATEQDMTEKSQGQFDDEPNTRYEPQYQISAGVPSFDDNASYYIRRQTSQSSRSNLKSPNNNMMSRTGSSFNRVRFKDPIAEENIGTMTRGKSEQNTRANKVLILK